MGTDMETYIMTTDTETPTIHHKNRHWDHTPSGQVVTVPPSILVRIVLVHLRKTSSTFSPVRALVSRNDNSSGGGGGEGGEWGHNWFSKHWQGFIQWKQYPRILPPTPNPSCIMKAVTRMPECYRSIALFPGRFHLQYLIALQYANAEGKGWEIWWCVVTSGR